MVAGQGSFKKSIGRRLVVGVKVGGHGRSLLPWALMKVARPGDHVTVVHVVKEKDARSGFLTGPIDAQHFDVYESFCKLKNINLQVKFACGSSITRILIEETLHGKALYLIVGKSKHHTLGPSAAVASHCAKRLPSNCSVLVLDDGKIVLQKGGTLSVTGDILPSKMRLNSFKGVFPSDTLEQPAKPSNRCSSGTSSIASCGHLHTRDATGSRKMEALKSCLPFRPLCRSCTSCKKELFDEKRCDFEQETSSSESPSTFKSFVTNSSKISQKEYDPSTFLYDAKKNVFSSANSPEKVAPTSKAGWPLLKYQLPLSKDLDSASRTIARQMSVVEWALTLPERRGAISNLSSPTLGRQNNNQSSNNSLKIVPAPVDSSHKEEHPLVQNLQNLCKNSACRRFTYQDLHSATSGFSPENLVGKGGWSRVYKGDLPDGKSVAVKSIQPSPAGDSELLREIEIMNMSKHGHIVSLIGYCVENEEYYMVYNLLTKGSLEDNLHGSRSKTPLPWKERLKVAIGIAEALDYLHHSSPRPIIHMDVKSSNILLSEDFEPQLSDFGLAKWAPTTSAYITCSDVVGTFGYLAPEYFMYGKVNEKTDVYAFGVVLLELITGQKPINDIGNDIRGQESLVIWARPLLRACSVNDLMDPLLEDNYDVKEAKRMILAASLCLMHASRFRPPMNQVLRLLRGEIDELNSRRQTTLSSDIDDLVEDEHGNSRRHDIQTHLMLAMLGVYDSTTSMSKNSLDGLQGSKTLEDS